MYQTNDQQPYGNTCNKEIASYQDTFILALELVQPCLTKRLLMGRKQSNQNNKQRDMATVKNQTNSSFEICYELLIPITLVLVPALHTQYP